VNSNGASSERPKYFISISNSRIAIKCRRVKYSVDKLRLINSHVRQRLGLVGLAGLRHWASANLRGEGCNEWQWCLSCVGIAARTNNSLSPDGRYRISRRFHLSASPWLAGPDLLRHSGLR
jgi:hypothetical protein